MSGINFAQLEADVEASLKGPWAWTGYPGDLKLSTTHSGRVYVMDFVRKGLNAAQPRFQPKRGRGMIKASDLLQFEVGDRSIVGEATARKDGSVYRYDVRGIDCPNARLIALAPLLAAEVLRLRALLASSQLEESQ